MTETPIKQNSSKEITEQDYKKACVLHYNRISQKDVYGFDEIPEPLKKAYLLGHFGGYKTLLIPIIVEKNNKGISIARLSNTYKLSFRNIRTIIDRCKKYRN